MFLKDQKHKRWCRHLQRVCGTKQLWEVLAFSGTFDLECWPKNRKDVRLGSASQPARRCKRENTCMQKKMQMLRQYVSRKFGDDLNTTMGSCHMAD